MHRPITSQAMVPQWFAYPTRVLSGNSVKQDTLAKVGARSQEPEVNHYLILGFWFLYFLSA